jgi:hypothetical protein
LAEGGCQIDSDESDNSENGYFILKLFIIIIPDLFLFIILEYFYWLSAEDYNETNWVFDTVKQSKTRSPNYSDEEDDYSKDSATIGPTKGKQAKVIMFSCL